MKRKIALGLCVLLSAGLLCACGSDPTTVDYNGYTYDQLKKANIESLEIIELLHETKSAGQDISGYADMYSDVSAEMVEAVDTWEETLAEVGGVYAGYDESTFKVTKSGKTLTTDVTVNFEGSERTATFEVVYTYWNMEVDGITINVDYSLGETMVKAGLNTIISMSIVFLVLILISLIIKGFEIFPYLEKKKKEKEAAAKAAAQAAAPAPAPAPVVPAPAPVVEEPVVEEAPADNTELIAVIAAAIAAASGTSTSDFVVRSINRR